MISNKKSKLFIISGAVIIALAFIMWQIIWFVSWHNSDLIFQGIKVNGISISGYTVDDANTFLDEKLSHSLTSRQIEVIYKELTETIKASEFAGYDYIEALHNAHNIGRSENIVDDYFTMIKTKLFGRNFFIEPKINDTSLENTLKRISNMYYIEPQNAQIVSFDPMKPKGEKLTVVEEVMGQELDIKKTLDSIKKVLISGQKKTNAYISEVEPTVTTTILQSIDNKPVINEQTFRNITVEQQNSILQIVGVGRYRIIYPGEEISVIDFLGGEDYIYFQMPDDGTGSDYEVALCEQIPTQIFSASLKAEVDVIKRQYGNIEQPNILSGTATIINKYYDMILKNNLDFPVIIRIGYNEHDITSKLYCEIYRPPMENATLLRSVIHDEGSKTLVDIKRVYIDKKGEPINSVVIETLVKDS